MSIMLVLLLIYFLLLSNLLPVLDQYSGDSSSAPIQATGHQLVSLCRSVVEEEKNQLLCPLMTR